MNRGLLSMGILCCLMAVCVLSLIHLHSGCQTYAALAAQVSEAVQADNTEDALRTFDALADGWEHFHSIAGIFVDGVKLDPIRESMAGLRPLIEQREPMALSELETLRQLILELYEEETPQLWHIL